MYRYLYIWFVLNATLCMKRVSWKTAARAYTFISCRITLELSLAWFYTVPYSKVFSDNDAYSPHRSSFNKPRFKNEELSPFVHTQNLHVFMWIVVYLSTLLNYLTATSMHVYKYPNLAVGKVVAKNNSHLPYAIFGGQRMSKRKVLIYWYVS